MCLSPSTSFTAGSLRALSWAGSCCSSRRTSRSPAGAVTGSVELGGVAIDKGTSYRIVTNNFLSDGGDGFPAFTYGAGKYVGGLDIDAFASYLCAVSGLGG